MTTPQQVREAVYDAVFAVLGDDDVRLPAIVEGVLTGLNALGLPADPQVGALPEEFVERVLDAIRCVCPRCKSRGAVVVADHGFQGREYECQECKNLWMTR